MTHPTTLTEAIEHFAGPDRALAFMVGMRWPDGVTCPRCDCERVSFLKSRRIWKCMGCRKQFSVKVGTIMEDSPLPLKKWLTCMWLIANANNGVSSYEAARSIGVTQKTAWFMLHRIRHALRLDDLPLDGEVEVDETHIGARAPRMNARARKRHEAKRPGAEKTVAQNIVQRGGGSRSRVVPDTSRHQLQGRVRADVVPGSTVYKDEHASYVGLVGEYAQLTVNHGAGQYVSGAAHVQNAENYWALFKRCVKGTWVNISPEHADAYLAEQDFRYTARKTDDGSRMMATAMLAPGKRLTWKDCVKGCGRGATPWP